MNTRVVIAFVIALLAPRGTGADEIPMRHGHFIGEKIFTLVLTSEQIAALEQRRKPGQRLYRVQMALNPGQIKEIERHSNKRVGELWILEGDWTDCSCQAYNIASRIEKNLLEVPVSYLLTEAEIAKLHPDSAR